MAVKIRMKRMGRKHRSFFRICATDVRSPRDGRVIEELGTYDPSVPETDARAKFNFERLTYWLGVGAQPSDKVSVLIKKYGPEGTHLEAQKAAVAKLTTPKSIPTTILPPPKAKPTPAEIAAEKAAAEAATAEAAAPEASAESEASSEAPAAEAAPAAE